MKGGDQVITRVGDGGVEPAGRQHVAEGAQPQQVAQHLGERELLARVFQLIGGTARRLRQPLADQQREGGRRQAHHQEGVAPARLSLSTPPSAMPAKIPMLAPEL